MLLSFISLLSQLAPLGTFLVAAFVAGYGIYQYNDASRPRLVAYTETTDIKERVSDTETLTIPAVVVMVTNTGKLPATDVRITIDPPFTSGMTQYPRREPLAVLMPQAKQDLYRQFYNDAVNAAKALTTEYKITFKYKKPGKRWHYLSETQIIRMDDALSDSSIRNETGGVSPSLVQESIVKRFPPSPSEEK